MRLTFHWSMKSLPLKSCYKLLQHQFLRRPMIHQSETRLTNSHLYSVSNRIWMLWSLTSRREPHCFHNSVLTRCLCLLMRLLGQTSKNVWTVAVTFVSLQKGEKQFWEGQTSKFSNHGGTYVWIIFSCCTFQESVRRRLAKGPILIPDSIQLLCGGTLGRGMLYRTTSAIPTK